MEEICRALQFGTPDPYSFGGFSLRFLMLAVPGVLLGHVLDEVILLAHQRYQWTATSCLLAQTIAWVIFFFLLHNYAPRYGPEFQSSYAGLAFITLFFTVQANYVTNLQTVLRIADRSIVA